MILKHKVYQAGEKLSGLYGSEIVEGTLLYPEHDSAHGVQCGGKKHYRFVFDTIHGSSGHGSPEGNIRFVGYMVGTKFEDSILPFIVQ